MPQCPYLQIRENELPPFSVYKVLEGCPVKGAEYEMVIIIVYYHLVSVTLTLMNGAPPRLSCHWVL